MAFRVAFGGADVALPVVVDDDEVALASKAEAAGACEASPSEVFSKRVQWEIVSSVAVAVTISVAHTNVYVPLAHHGSFLLYIGVRPSSDRIPCLGREWE